MKKKFYTFNSSGKRGVLQIQSEIKYPTLVILGKETELKKNNKFSIDKGKKLFDLIEFADSRHFAISQRFKDCMDINQINGYSTFELIIDGINEKYYGFQNIAEVGPILNQDDLMEMKTESIEFDLSTWDGSEIFHLKDTLLHVCTERVKNIIEENKLTNIEFKPL
jgi:hypothetical protein